MTEVFIALGGNLGDRAAALEAAIAGLAPHVRVLERSPVYETAPQYVTDQPRFLNMVVRGETALDAAGLLRRLKSLEELIGRTPGPRFGPRVIDLDILFYGDQVIDTPELSVPHPRLAERVFVLRPLADLAPGLVHPVSGRTVTQMLAALSGTDEIVPYRSGAADQGVR